MDNQELNELPRLSWMESRIPKRKALVTFVADGADCPQSVEKAMEGHSSRWYPEEGGHRVLVLYEGGSYDAGTFRVEPEAWDHEHCDVCGEIIPPMKLCYVTPRGHYIALCENCHQTYVIDKLTR
jgi:hypothetical protein